MMVNYGCSEYAQAFSRIGSLHRNVYIVNEKIKLQKILLNEQLQFIGLETNYNNELIRIDPSKGGLIVSSHYTPIVSELCP